MSSVRRQTVKKFLKNNGRHLNNGGLLSILQKTKDDGAGLILCQLDPSFVLLYRANLFINKIWSII